MTTIYRTASEELAARAEGPGWLGSLRHAGLRRFEQVGFPSSRDEEWRFTPITPIARAVFQPAEAPAAPVTAADLARFTFGHPEWPTLVFVNGRLAPELSSRPVLPEGTILTSLAEALVTHPELVEPHLARQAGPEATPFTALNAAFIRIPKNADLADPIHLVFVTSPGTDGRMTHPRNLVVVESGARVSLVESYFGLSDTAGYLTNAVTEVVLGDNAWMEHPRLQREGEAAYHIASSHVRQGRDSHYRSFTLSMGAAISRHNLHTRLDAPNTEALLYGLTIAHRDQLVDNHTAIDHVQPDCRSWEVYKAILDDRAHGVFNGKVYVTPEAQKTDAKQTNRALLLSNTARIDTKPQLEIFADDVKCTHGATVGYLDELPLFYFRSRGIPADQSRQLLTYAFAAEVMDEVKVEPVRAELDRVIRQRLGVRDGA
ncbi:MAG: FeS assembly protein SufD [Gemmatimonadetes bacterium]|nr:FeS assembly protein SufD [Gemmatimonadota bacterium]